MSCVVKHEDLLVRVLAARDARARARETAVTAAVVAGVTSGAVGELSLNVPGWPKLGREWFLLFARGLEAALAGDAMLHIVAMRADAAGYWALLAGSAPAIEHKRASCAIEDAAPWGRLLDFDWYARGAKIPRENLGFLARCCWVCGAAQGVCISTLRHEIADVRARALELAGSARRVPARSKAS